MARTRALRTLALLMGALALGLVAAPAVHAQAELITGSSAGAAQLGSNLAQLQSQLGPGYDFAGPQPIIVDGSGYTISKDGTVVFHAIAEPGTEADATSPLTFFIVESDAYATAAGIGPGSLISDGVTAYGSATLSYHHENESREFVNFAGQPAGRMQFRTGSGPEAGIYPDSQTGPLFETTEFAPDATIKTVWISCIASSGECPTIPTLPDTGLKNSDLALSGAGLILCGLAMVAGGRRLCSA